MYNIYVRKIKFLTDTKQKRSKNKWQASLCSWLIGAIIVMILFILDLIYSFHENSSNPKVFMDINKMIPKFAK